MKQEGIVSLWLGHASSAATLWSALEVEFSEDGDFLGSDFSRAFGIDYHDDALREAEFFDPRGCTLDQLMNRASYGSAILPMLHESKIALDHRTNCMVLLYDYRHVAPVVARLSGVTLGFKGAVPYAQSPP